MEATKRVGGDAYAEIIKEGDVIVNLKAIDPGSMTIVTNEKGMIVAYEQNIKGKAPKRWKPEQIFHLSHNRFSWQCHGTSDIDSKTILANEEMFESTRLLMKRQARPMGLWKLKENNPAKISEFVNKVTQARSYGEDLFIPDGEDIATYESIEVVPSPQLFSWMDEIRKRFYRTSGTPELIPSGGGDSTESGGKIGYFTWTQYIEKDQVYLERQIWNQLYLKVDFIPPFSIAPDLQRDANKDGQAQQMNFQQSDQTVGSGR